MKGMFMRTNAAFLLRFVAVGLVPVACLQPADADEYHYCGPSQYEGEAWFSQPQNWTPSGGPPGSSDIAVFDQDDYFDLYLAQPVITNKLLKVNAGSVEFFMAVQTVDPCDEPVTYELLGSGTFLRTAAIIGVTPGVPAALSLSGGWESHCAPPGTVNADGMLVIGQTVGSDGRLEFGRSDTGPVTWTSAYPTLVGSAGTGELNIRDTAELINSSATLGVVAGAVGTAEIKGTWTNNGLLQVGDAGSGTIHVYGTLANNGDCYLASEPGATAHVYLMPSSIYSADWQTQGDLYVGGTDAGAGGGAIVTIYAGQFQVAQDTTVWDPGAIVVYDGAVQMNNLDIRDGGYVAVSGGTLDSTTLNIFDGAELTADGGLITSDAVDCAGSMEISAGQVDAAYLNITGDVTVLDPGALDLSGGPLDIAGGGSLNGAIIGDASTPVALYDAGSSWSMPGSLLVGASGHGDGHIHALSLQPGTTVTVGEEVTVQNVLALTIGGGTINADLFNLQDANLHDFGIVNGKFLTTGSVTATGDLVVGDIGHSSGVQIGGTLDVGPHHVTLNKQGLLFVYGSTNIAGGTLTVPGGFGITSSLHASGFGVIDTPNDPTKSLLNDGSIIGNSAGEQIELTGYVTGLGTLDHVTVSGTDAPGYAGPTAVSRGSVDYAGELIIEIAGLTAGTEHDQINHSAAVGLGGELTVELINGFEPSPGDSFTILTYGSRFGQFDTLSLPTLDAGLQWNVDYGTSAVTLVVVEGGEQALGDLNCDGWVNNGDIDAFVLALSFPEQYANEYPGCDIALGDINDDGWVNNGDIDAFVNLLSSQ